MAERSKYHIRLANSDDVQAISNLTIAAYSKWIAVIDRNPLPMDIDYNEAIKIHRFDLLYEGLTLRALIETYQSEDCLFIENLCVAPEAQRRGLGKTLLKHAEQIAIQTHNQIYKAGYE